MSTKRMSQRLFLAIFLLGSSVLALADGDCGATNSCPQIVETIVVTASGGCGTYCTSYSGIDVTWEAPDYTPAGWNDAASPRCSQEEQAARDFTLMMAAHINGQGPPPGVVIMAYPQFNDQAFQGPGWEKRDDKTLVRTRQPNGSFHMNSVHIHYMYHAPTKNFTQVRFTSSLSAACGGPTGAA